MSKFEQFDAALIFGELDLTFLQDGTAKIKQDDQELCYARLSNGVIIEPEHGTTTDFASIPRLFWRLVPKTGTARFPIGRAAVFHDYLYRAQQVAGIAITREFADKVFYYLMISDGVSRPVAWLFYKILRAAGWKAWNDNLKKLQDNKEDSAT
jgi:hypothetical protein